MGAKMMTKSAYREFINMTDELNQAIRPRAQFRYGKTLNLLTEIQELLIQPESWQAWHERQKGGPSEKI